MACVLATTREDRPSGELADLDELLPSHHARDVGRSLRTPEDPDARAAFLSGYPPAGARRRRPRRTPAMPPSSRPKGDGDKRKALPYAQLLSRVREDERSAGGLSAALLLNLEAVILAELTTTLPCWTRLDSAVRPRAAASTASGRVGREFETDICAALERPRERDVSSPRACAISGRCGSLRASVSTIARRTRARRYRFVGRRGHPGARALQCAPSPVGRLTS
jgi:hypothetical protein